MNNFIQINKIFDSMELGMYVIGWYGRAYHPVAELRSDIGHKILLEEYFKRVGLLSILIPEGDSEDRRKFIEEVRLRLQFHDEKIFFAYNFGTILGLCIDNISAYQKDLLELGKRLDICDELLIDFLLKLSPAEGKSSHGILIKELIIFRNVLIDNLKKPISDESRETIRKKEDLKSLIANNKTEQAINELIQIFKKTNKLDGLNFMIMQSSAWFELSTKEINNIITIEEARIEKARINNSIIVLIDRFVSLKNQ